MKKSLFMVVLFTTSSIFYAQVGIDTDAPKATLDVRSKPTDLTKTDGFIAPRIKGSELKNKDSNYATDQTGAIVYVTEALAVADVSTKTANVTSIGYYYFDGSLWQQFTPNLTEPWFNQATNTQATSNTQNIYQTGKVSIGGNNATGTATIINSPGTPNMVDLAMIANRPSGNPASLNFISNAGTGSYSSLSLSGDKLLVFSTDGDAGTYSRNAFSIIPHSNGGGSAPFGFKITEQGLSAINSQIPTETFDVGGTFRIRQLPLNGTTNGIYTKPDGSSSLPASTNVSGLAKTQTFTGTRTVVADNNGVLGYVDYLPTTLKMTSIEVKTTPVYVLPPNTLTAKYTGFKFKIPPGAYKIDLSMGIVLGVSPTYRSGVTFVRFRLGDSESDLNVMANQFSADAIHPRLASGGFSLAENQGTVTGSLAVNNRSSAEKTYYLFVDNFASTANSSGINVQFNWNESSFVYYPITYTTQ